MVKDLFIPDDIVKIIKEFSRPLTRPDWRTIHKFTQRDLTTELLNIPHVYIDTTCFVLQHKNILLIFDNYIFCVFRFRDYLIENE